MSNTIAPNYMSFSGAFRSLSRGNDLTSSEQSQIKGTIIVARVNIIYTGIGSNLTQSQIVTVPGAEPGDLVILGCPNLEIGIMVTAFVNAKDTVTVRVGNFTPGNGVTPGSLDFSIAVVKP